ncbi:universal stress protein [Deinococcus detaillensis]|uniref:Universal stress protein n=1 Tax=Deinococcus detaillensis TaxID=2592048 RepID=A0A553UGU2_9DEIO|nr:universal stress protein [Deinococcus detaillensis]TSA79415.1 universal stress protein [Deinococcus detaillensis]
MFDHILVPIDGSPLSALALPVAAELARCHHSTLTVLYVVPPLPVIYGDSAYTFGTLETRERAKAEGQRLLEDARTALGSPNIRLLCLEDGNPRTAQAIADVAEQQQCSLVVMGTHGRSGLDRFFLGSVAEGVMRRIGVPVLLVREPKTTASPLSGTEESQRVAMLEASA